MEFDTTLPPAIKAVGEWHLQRRRQCSSSSRLSLCILRAKHPLCRYGEREQPLANDAWALSISLPHLSSVRQLHTVGLYYRVHNRVVRVYPNPQVRAGSGTYFTCTGRVQVRSYGYRLELCADELVVGGGVGWSYDRWRRRQRRQTGRESSETAHSLDRRFFWF